MNMALPSVTIPGYFFDSKDGFKYVLKFFTHSVSQKKYIFVAKSQHEDNVSIKETLWPFNFTRDGIQELMTNTDISEDARKYFNRIIKNHAFT